ncbi:response regulator transcription factor [Tsuneonella sp. YG55]|uniref:Response regulator transcription factor n=1 Tax=Tsuneonella litorea TaxID=2976475 RepID=A0A9X2W1K5_9SPHN|nr:response regulator transcription factor [Tsuneonella litorea]MCT2559362.1 response regulator transcription factor [Tsuneonella litorea]
MRPIIVIDDHELAHSGIRLLLSHSDEFCVAGCFCTAREGIDFAARSERPLILLDLELPDIEGLSALGEIVARGIGDVVVMTGVTRPSMLCRAVELGARGLVCKGDPIEEAHQALRVVSKGDTFVSRCAAELLARASVPPVTLSERQQAILQLLASGCSNKEIGYRLSISAPTVSFHLAEIRRKLDADNSRQVVEKARTAGILASPLT